MLSDSSRLPDAGLEEEAATNDPIHATGPGWTDDLEPKNFKPKRILILTKLSRLEFEQRKHPHLTEHQLKEKLKKRGSDMDQYIERHKVHNSYLKAVVSELEGRGIEQRVCQRNEFSEELVQWADAIFTAGGDGTFLLAASKVRDSNKPVIGINTDPVSSEGYLCLQKKLPESKLASALDRLFSGDFKWLWRQRIRITITGKNRDDPVDLHDLQLSHPEERWSEHVKELEDSRVRSHQRKCRLLSRFSFPSTKQEIPEALPSPPVERGDQMHPKPTGSDYDLHQNGLSINADLDNNFHKKVTQKRVPNCQHSPSSENERQLPIFALNDVFIGESLSSRVSYYEIKIENGKKTKQKSSGLTVCTGTGSTSWYFNINKMTEHCISDILQIVREETGTNLPTDSQSVSQICKRFNNKLIFSPSDPRLAYSVRDPVFNATFAPVPPRGFAKRILVKSRCFDAHLVVDGGLSFAFNDGAKVQLEVKPEDSLRTVVFRDGK